MNESTSSGRLGNSSSGGSGGTGSGSRKRGQSPTVPNASTRQGAPSTRAPSRGRGKSTAAGVRRDEQEGEVVVVVPSEGRSEEGANAGGGGGTDGLLDGVDGVEEVEDDASDSDDDEEPDFWSKYGVIDQDALDEDAEIEI